VKPGVTVAIPAIPTRLESYLQLAIRSVLTQTYPVAGISLAIDTGRHGAWHTRQRALDGVTTEWVAYLDDDDEMYPQHIEHLVDCALETDADYVFSYWDLSRTPDLLGHFGRPFNSAEPHHTTMTILVRTELSRSVGFTPRLPEHQAGGEDWRHELGCVAAGAKIVHLPEQTWYWRHHGANTSGREDRW
jgi:hypothetical protein